MTPSDYGNKNNYSPVLGYNWIRVHHNTYQNQFFRVTSINPYLTSVSNDLMSEEQVSPRIYTLSLYDTVYLLDVIYPREIPTPAVGQIWVHKENLKHGFQVLTVDQLGTYTAKHTIQHQDWPPADYDLIAGPGAPWSRPRKQNQYSNALELLESKLVKGALTAPEDQGVASAQVPTEAGTA